ncbi:glycosyltransferase family 2 protein [Oerskovia sp. NPDC057915]|uniref:glycosyltransferase family 2 protein n=1 Tax=Oerskovia sp. NPDC057915 TaxID=3346280 RepID=UPI0036DF8BBD
MSDDLRWWDPYAGLPAVVQVVFWVLLVVTVTSFVWVLVLAATAWVQERALARRAKVVGRQGDAPESDFLWVFVVPALDEEVTIEDSVTRLAATEATHRAIVVVDDGSTDRTAEILADLAIEDLRVLRRVPPDARRGKSAVLDDAWSYVHRDLLAPGGPFAAWEPSRVVVGIVDADGRLAPTAPAVLARHFADERVGGVQVLVRIYNRRTVLTWAQDVEFGVFGLVYQLARGRWGTANMGGNGQFNRLSALDDVVTEDGMPPGVVRGPWRDRLTEDQDLGVRLVHEGWRGEQTVETQIEQQGVSGLHRLVRQRTRWAQGGWQALDLVGSALTAPVSSWARLDQLYYLLTPVLQTAMGFGLLLSLLLLGVEHVPFYSLFWPVVVFFLGLSFGPGFVGLARRGRGVVGVLVAVVAVVPYVLYSWILFPVVLRALFRQVAGRTGWAKTAREPLTSVEDEGRAAR